MASSKIPGGGRADTCHYPFPLCWLLPGQDWTMPHHTTPTCTTATLWTPALSPALSREGDDGPSGIIGRRMVVVLFSPFFSLSLLCMPLPLPAPVPLPSTHTHTALHCTHLPAHPHLPPQDRFTCLMPGKLPNRWLLRHQAGPFLPPPRYITVPYLSCRSILLLFMLFLPRGGMCMPGELPTATLILPRLPIYGRNGDASYGAAENTCCSDERQNYRVTRVMA